MTVLVYTIHHRHSALSAVCDYIPIEAHCHTATSTCMCANTVINHSVGRTINEYMKGFIVLLWLWQACQYYPAKPFYSPVQPIYRICNRPGCEKNTHLKIIYLNLSQTFEIFCAIVVYRLTTSPALVFTYSPIMDSIRVISANMASSLFLIPFHYRLDRFWKWILLINHLCPKKICLKITDWNS